MANRKLNVIIHRYETPTRYLDGEDVEWVVLLKSEDGSIPRSRQFAERRDALNYADGLIAALKTLDQFGTLVTELVSRVGSYPNQYVRTPMELDPCSDLPGQN